MYEQQETTSIIKEEKFKIRDANEVPLLDMNMSCPPEGGIRFGIFRKK